MPASAPVVCIFKSALSPHFQTGANTAVSNQSSAFLWLQFEGIVGHMPDGTPVSQEPAPAGRVVIVGEEPLLEAVASTNGQLSLFLYSKPRTTNWLETTAQIEPASIWSQERRVVMPVDELAQVIQPVFTNISTIFIRARREP